MAKKTGAILKGLSMATPFPEVMRGIMSGVGYGKAILSGGGYDPRLGGLTHKGATRFEKGPAGTTIARLPEPMAGGDMQALGNVILANPDLAPHLEQLIPEHELGHVLQSEVAGPLLPLLQAGAGAAQMLRGKDFYEDNPFEKSAGRMARIKMMMEGEPLPPGRTASGKGRKSYQEGTMPRSIASYQPGRAQAYQSPFVVPPMGGMGDQGGMFNYMSGLLERQMKLKEQMARAQLDQMKQQQEMAKQQLAQAKQRAMREGSLWTKQRMGEGGLHGGKPAPGMPTLRDWEMMSNPMNINMPGREGAFNRVFGWLGPQAIAQMQMQKGKNWTDAMMQGSATAGVLQGKQPQVTVNPGTVGGGGLSTGPWMPPGTIQGGIPQSAMAYMQQQTIPGRTAEKGGRVPKTGTYKLHKGEVVLNKPQSDMMFPKPPEPAQGLPIKSYQEGTDPPLWGGLGSYVPGVPREQLPIEQAINRWMTPGASYQPSPYIPPSASEVTTPMESMAFNGDMGNIPPPPSPEAGFQRIQPIEGLTVSEEPSGTKKYTLTGEPETDKERIQRLRESADRAKENARLQRARARLLVTYADEKGEVDPMLKKQIQERQWVAKQYDQDAAADLKEAEDLASQEKEAETRTKIAETQAGAIGTEAMGRMRVAETKAQAEAVADMHKGISSVLTDYNKGLYNDSPIGADAAFVQGITNALGPSALMIMSQRMGKSVQDTLDTIRAIAAAEVSGRTEEGIPVPPGDALKLLWVMMGESPPSQI